MKSHVGYLKAVVIFGVLTASAVYGQGPLNPPGPPGPTMKTLAQVEPRIPITNVPFTISQPGSYYLTTNLACGSSAIIIRASHVTLDMMGFSLCGTGSADGVHSQGSSTGVLWDVSIRNGTIVGFDDGIDFDYVRGWCLEDLVVASNADDGIHIAGGFVGAGGGRMSRCSVLWNGGRGVYTSGDGNLVEECVIVSNRNMGLYLCGAYGKSCDENVVRDCMIARNGAGIYLDGNQGECNGNLITQCAIGHNGGRGIYLGTDASGGECDGNVILGCALERNGSVGIHIYYADGNVIRGCVLEGNGSEGIDIYNSDGNRIEGNAIWGRSITGYGVYSLWSQTGNFIFRNTCSGCTNTCYSLDTDDTYGPIVTNSGALAVTGAAAHAWANFAR